MSILRTTLMGNRKQPSRIVTGNVIVIENPTLKPWLTSWKNCSPKASRGEKTLELIHRPG